VCPSFGPSPDALRTASIDDVPSLGTYASFSSTCSSSSLTMDADCMHQCPVSAGPTFSWEGDEESSRRQIFQCGNGRAGLLGHSSSTRFHPYEVANAVSRGASGGASRTAWTSFDQMNKKGEQVTTKTTETDFTDMVKKSPKSPPPSLPDTCGDDDEWSLGPGIPELQF
jgi:hypothetical protein